MDEKEKAALQYRFSGYQLPKVNFTAGFPSYVMQVHPYFKNQPQYYQKPTIPVNPGPMEVPLYPMQPLDNNSDNSDTSV